MSEQISKEQLTERRDRPYLVIRKPGSKNVWRIVEPQNYIETTEPGNFFAWAEKDHAFVEFHKGDN